MPDIIFTRINHLLEEEFGHLSKFGYVEISSGICWLAAVTRSHSYDTEIIDAMALRLDNEKLASIIADKKPSYLGISACTMDINGASELAEMVKRARPSTVIIIGGPHITAVPQETIENFPAFDIGVIGEGEDTIVALLDALEQGDNKDLSGIDGLIYRDGDSAVTSAPRKFIKDLDSMPLPAWDLLPDLRKNYFAPPWTMHNGKTATIITSRGCPCQCIFCDRKVFGNVVRYYSAGYVMDMIRTLYSKYGIRHLRIGDDNFIINKKRLDEICDYLIKEKLDMTWSCLARVDTVRPEMLARMKLAGCWSIAFGVETGSQEIHRIEKKNVTLEQIAGAVAMTRRAGIRTISFNMIGHPLETIETIKKTIDFNKKIKVDEFKTQFMVPFPGTELYQFAEKYGIFDKNWRRMTVFTEPIFIPYGLTKDDLLRWNKRGFRSFYLQPRIIFSYLTSVRSFDELKIIFIGAFTIVAWKIKEFFQKRR